MFFILFYSLSSPGMSTKRKQASVGSGAPPAKKRIHRQNKATAESFGDVLSALVTSAVSQPTPSAPKSSADIVVKKADESKKQVSFSSPEDSTKSTTPSALSRTNDKMKQERAARREKLRQMRDKKPRSKEALAIEQNLEEIRLRRQEKEKKMERRLLLDKDHVRAEFNDLEKRLVRIATKGVVTLFNAVSKQQKELAAATELSTSNSKNKEKLVDEVVNTGFLELLKESGKAASKAASKSLGVGSESESDSDSGSDSDSDSKSKSKSAGWKALDENYMLGSGTAAEKLKNWEESDSSDESGDGESD